jgi:hypothetical protein
MLEQLLFHGDPDLLIPLLQPEAQRLPRVTHREMMDLARTLADLA